MLCHASVLLRCDAGPHRLTPLVVSLHLSSPCVCQTSSCRAVTCHLSLCHLVPSCVTSCRFYVSSFHEALFCRVNSPPVPLLLSLPLVFRCFMSCLVVELLATCCATCLVLHLIPCFRANWSRFLKPI